IFFMIAVVLLDTTTEEKLDWTRYPFGPQANTPGGFHDDRYVTTLPMGKTAERKGLQADGREEGERRDQDTEIRRREETVKATVSSRARRPTLRKLHSQRRKSVSRMERIVASYRN
ncbi:hypothetical protein ALC62_10646, partial [Cyphomyrmex costatus]